jgi:hypothetical protein
MMVVGGKKYHAGNRHVQPKESPNANLMLAILDKYGIEQDTFGSSTGRVDL